MYIHFWLCLLTLWLWRRRAAAAASQHNVPSPHHRCHEFDRIYVYIFTMCVCMWNKYKIYSHICVVCIFSKLLLMWAILLLYIRIIKIEVPWWCYVVWKCCYFISYDERRLMLRLFKLNTIWRVGDDDDLSSILCMYDTKP